jgi:polyhydroxyalkanoate synthesis repressor PhaR
MTIIKRYSNRKLYDSEAAHYVTLDELGDRIRAGEDVIVIDHESGADLTAVTLMQIMFEREKKVGGMLPKAILTGLIQAGNTAVDSLRNGLNTLVENTPAFEAEIRRRVSVMVDDGLVAVEEAQRMTDLLLNRWKNRSATVDTETSSEAASAVVDMPAASEVPPAPAGAQVYPVEPVSAEPVIVEPAPIEPAAAESAADDAARLQQQIADLERQIAELKAKRGD